MHLSDSLLSLQRGFKFGEVINMQEVIIWKEKFVRVDFNTALATLGYMSVLTCQAVTRSQRWNQINSHVACVLGGTGVAFLRVLRAREGLVNVCCWKKKCGMC